MSPKRYQLWMQLVYYQSGNPAEKQAQGRVVFNYRIIDTQAANYRAQQAEVLTDGYSPYGYSDSPLDVENFAIKTTVANMSGYNH